MNPSRFIVESANAERLVTVGLNAGDEYELRDGVLYNQHGTALCRFAPCPPERQTSGFSPLFFIRKGMR